MQMKGHEMDYGQQKTKNKQNVQIKSQIEKLKITCRISKIKNHKITDFESRLTKI